MNRPRHGQWVSTSTPVPGALTTPDGRAIGIYVREHVPGVVNGAEPTIVPEHIAFVDADGENLVAFDPATKSVVNVRCAPGDLADLQPVIEADHLPASRRSHFPAGHRLDP